MEKDISQLSDEAVVDIIRNRNPELYSEIVRRYQDRLWRYACRLVSDGDAARDIVQESFLKAYINLNGFDTERKLSPWLYRIVHNEVVSWFRREHPVLSLDENPWIADTIPAHTTVIDEAEGRELAQLLRECLSYVPLVFRETIALYYLEGLSYQEISDILHIPLNTVGTRINRGKKMLRDAYNLKEKHT